MPRDNSMPPVSAHRHMASSYHTVVAIDRHAGVDMAIYDTYTTRSRVPQGVALKRRQSEGLFRYGLAHSPREAPRILEIGPGDGDIAALCADAGHPYIAVEGSEEVARALRQRGTVVHHHCVPPLPNALSRDFSCCFLLHVIEHMPSPMAAAELVEQIRLVLRPGGALVVACPDFLGWGARFYDCDYTHTYPLTRRRLLRLLADQGLQVVVDTTYRGAWFGAPSILLSGLVRLAYPPLLDRLIGRHVPGDVINRGALTFLPNLLAVAIRPA